MSTAVEGKSKFCSNCGGPLAPAAAFCRKCGANVEPERAATGEAATEQMPRQQAPPPPVAPPRPAERSGKRAAGLGRTLALATAIGLLVGGGVAGAIVLLDDDGSESTAIPPGAAATVPSSGVSPTESGEADSSSGPAGFPSGDRAQIAQEVQDLLLAFHEDVVDQRFRDAWSLLSARKRSQTLREDGYRKWADAQASLSEYLSPAGLTVRVDALEDDGVARVLVSGMGWSAPGAACSEWSGLTWAKYEAGAWSYDPGYSTTAEREQAWQQRYDELLGANC